MSTLADELMNDLEGDSGSDEGGGYSDPDRQNPSQVMAANSIANKLEPGDNDDDDDDDDDAAMREVNDGLAEGQVMVPEGGVQPTLELDPSVVDEMKLETVEDVNTVAKLAKGKTMANVLKVSSQIQLDRDRVGRSLIPSLSPPLRLRLRLLLVIRALNIIARTRILIWLRTQTVKSTN